MDLSRIHAVTVDVVLLEVAAVVVVVVSSGEESAAVTEANGVDSQVETVSLAKAVKGEEASEVVVVGVVEVESTEAANIEVDEAAVVHKVVFLQQLPPLPLYNSENVHPDEK